MGFQRIGAGLPGLLARWIDDPELEHSIVTQAWEQAVGPAIAGHTRVQGIGDGVLRVCVLDAAWERSLREMEADLLVRLREALGDRAPHGIDWVEGPGG